MYRGIAQLVEYRSPKPWVAGSNPPAPAIIIGQKRSDRENKRKREISRDFSRFFAPTFFQSFIDPFSLFHWAERNELWIEPFFPNIQSKTSDRKDLNPRQGFKFFRFFASDTNCLQIIRYKISPSLLQKDPNPRNLEKHNFQKQSIVQSEGFEPTNTKYWPAEDKEKATDHKTRGKNIYLLDKLEFVLLSNQFEFKGLCT